MRVKWVNGLILPGCCKTVSAKCWRMWNRNSPLKDKQPDFRRETSASYQCKHTHTHAHAGTRKHYTNAHTSKGQSLSLKSLPEATALRVIKGIVHPKLHFAPFRTCLIVKLRTLTGQRFQISAAWIWKFIKLAKSSGFNLNFTWTIPFLANGRSYQCTG